MGDYCDMQDTKRKMYITSFFEEVELTDSQFLMPGMIDTHINATQYTNTGLGYTKDYYEWLNKYIYPLEQKFEDVEYARKVYNKLVVSNTNVT